MWVVLQNSSSFSHWTGNVSSVLLITSGLVTGNVSHTVRTMHTAAFGGINVQCAGRVGLFKASFVRVRRNSARLSISLSQVTVSRESCCSGTKRPRRPGPRAAAPADSWARRRCDSGAELGRRASHHTAWIGTWLLSGSAAAQQWLRENGRSHRVTVTTALLLLT